MTTGEDWPATVAWQLRAVNGPAPVREHRFHPERKWQFDLAWPDRKIALEVDGGSWVGGRHSGGAGFYRDCEKLSWAAILGWRVLRVTPAQVRDGKALTWLLAAFDHREEG